MYKEFCSCIVENSYKGYNGCMFVYGQTGAGKSFTMFGGPPPIEGMIPRMGMAICAERKRRLDNNDGDLEFFVSFMEIYGERLNDLLDNNCHEGDGLRIREDPKLGVFVPGIVERPCAELQDLQDTVDFGNANRAIAATNMNPTSSRSHAVLVFRVVAKNKVEGQDDLQEGVSKINLIDLAGSERASKTGATGDKLKEGAAINGSLTCLGQVIREVCNNAMHPDRKPQYVSFRSSKLTYLLRDLSYRKLPYFYECTCFPRGIQRGRVQFHAAFREFCQEFENESRR